MNQEIIKDKLKVILKKNEIDISYKKNISISPQIDSIVFINTLVEIEEEFSIRFPDELINISLFSSMDRLVCIIEELLR